MTTLPPHLGHANGNDTPKMQISRQVDLSAMLYVRSPDAGTTYSPPQP